MQEIYMSTKDFEEYQKEQLAEQEKKDEINRLKLKESMALPNQFKKRTLKVMTNIYSSAGLKNKHKNCDLSPELPSRPIKDLRLRGINTINVEEKHIMNIKSKQRGVGSSKVDDYTGA